MKKLRCFTFFTIGLILFFPFVNLASAQAWYVGVKEGNNHMWKLGIYNGNFQGWFEDDLEETLGNFFPIGPINLTRLYIDGIASSINAPQTYWFLNVTSFGPQITNTLLSPYDNTQITSTPVYGRGGWALPHDLSYNAFYDGVWNVVNDTSSFLRQTLNLTLVFSPYGIMYVPLSPRFINWGLFATEFNELMDSKGGLYDNVSTVALSNGYTLHVPSWGFENNTKPIEIKVLYGSSGTLINYEFRYGGLLLTNYVLHIEPLIPEGLVLTIVWSIVIFGVVVLLVFLARKLTKKTVYIGV